MRKRIRNFFRKGIVTSPMLVGAAILGLFTLISLFVVPSIIVPVADMRIDPPFGVAKIGETFTVRIVVESSIPVNVFGGEVVFNPEILEVDSIDYNTSIADLWAELPWYSNGDGTLNFGGGTTARGAFIGVGPLIEITFKTLQEGDGILALRKAQIFQHDGLGTLAELEEPIDAVFSVKSPEENVLTTVNTPATYKVVTEPPSTDLNGDGEQSIADISIFMLNLTGNNPRYDFNIDGKVDTKDLSIMLNAQ